MKKTKYQNVLLDYLYPRRCPVCDEPTKKGRWICPGCVRKLRYVTGATCFCCGKELSSAEEEYCFDCRERSHLYRQGVALYEYGAIRNSLYRFKYQGRCEYADFYGEDMARRLGRQIKVWNAQCLVPVPLYPGKERQRGYNQAQLIAEKLSERIQIPVEKRLIGRVKKTVAMKNLDVRMRQINLKKAFNMLQDDVKLKRVIVVDDIYTSGSTVDAMARVLMAAGVEEVYFVALAIGTGL